MLKNIWMLLMWNSEKYLNLNHYLSIKKCTHRNISCRAILYEINNSIDIKINEYFQKHSTVTIIKMLNWLSINMIYVLVYMYMHKLAVTDLAFGRKESRPPPSIHPPWNWRSCQRMITDGECWQTTGSLKQNHALTQNW